MSSSKQRQPSYIDDIRRLTLEVKGKEASASQKCDEIKKIVEKVYKQNGSTTLGEYRKTITEILQLLDKDKQESVG